MRVRSSRRSATARRRRPPRGVLLAALLAASVVGGARAALALPYGVNAHIPTPEQLDAIRAAGIEWVRIDFSWATVEPAQDRFDWHVYDAVADAAAARGLRIFATLADTPAWATQGSPGTGVPADPMDWYDACYRAAARYRGRIDHWGMWNEPNSPRFWAGSRDDYIETILRTGSRAVHAANPAARVCGPELSHLQSQHWNDWLWDVLGRASDALDVVTLHLYTDGSATALVNALENGDSEPWGSPAVRGILAKHGWLGRPFWLTETGVDAASPGSGGEQAQASFVTGVMTALFGRYRPLPWVHKVFIYELSDDPRFPQRWGLLTAAPALEPKPAYTGLQALTARLAVDDAEAVRSSLPDRLAPGEARTVSVTMRNTGTTTWRGEDGYELSAFGGSDPLADPVVALPPAVAVQPGGEITLVFPVHAGAGGSAVPLVTAWQMSRTGAWAFGEVLRRVVAVTDAAPPAPLYVPAAAHADGARGTRWRTELVLHNPSLDPLDVTVAALEQGRPNDRPRRAPVSLPAGSTVRIDDAVARLFGLAATVALRIDAARPGLQVWSRTTAVGAAGSAGDFIPALPAPPAGAGPRRLIALARSADPAQGLRTNLGLLNAGDAGVTADVELTDGSGAPLGTLAYSLPARGFVQVNDVLAAVGGAVEGATAVVRAAGDAPVIAYAAIVDNETADTTLVLPGATSTSPLVVAAAVRGAGLAGSRWRTDLDLHNPGADEASVTVELLDGAAAPARRLVTVAPGATRHVTDALDTLFAADGLAALRLLPEGSGIVAASRTANAVAGGDLGQSVPAVDEGEAAADGDTVPLLLLTRSADPKRGARSNLGVVNLSVAPLTVRIELYRAPAALLGALTVQVAPGSSRLLVDPLGSFTALDVPDGFAVARAIAPGARFLAYVSVVDNRSGDPSFALGARE